MLVHIARSVRSAVLVLVCLCLPLAGTASTNHHVILITIDGFPSYLLADPQAPIPTIRKLAADGAAAEGMRVSNPSVTWPNHTTLVTGVHPENHSVLFNGVLTRSGPGLPVKVDPQRDKSDLVAVPTLYDHLRRAGYRTAAINWPCTRGARTLDDDFPDVPDQILHMTPRLRDELVARGILPDASQASFASLSSARKDQIWTAAAAQTIRNRRPNFMLFHMLITDSTQHKYGPQSPAASTAFALADAHLAEVLRAVEAAGARERTTLFVTADHGFDTALKIVRPNLVFRKAGLLRMDAASGVAQARAQIISEGGTAMVYCSDPATRKQDCEQVLALMRQQEGIADILQPEQFAALHLPDPSTNRQMADLILVAQPGYAFSNEARGEESVVEAGATGANLGYHGFLSTNPKMNAAFIAWGRGIKVGVKLGVIDNIDVAPTIARLLGQKLPGAEGKVLREMLTEEAAQ